MNERIRELMVQSNPQGDFTDSEWVFENFAQLIIRECIDQCEEIAVGADKIANGQFVTDAGRMLHQGMWGGAKNCIGQIKDHFGVE